MLLADEVAARLKIEERLRDNPQQERWMIAAYEEGATTIGGEPTPVCHIQGPGTSSQGVEVVPLGDLAEALRERDELRACLDEWKQSARTRPSEGTR